MASPAPTAPVCSQHCVSPASGFVLRSLRLKAFAPALPRAALQLAPGKIPSCDLEPERKAAFLAVYCCPPPASRPCVATTPEASLPGCLVSLASPRSPQRVLRKTSELPARCATPRRVLNSPNDALSPQVKAEVLTLAQDHAPACPSRPAEGTSAVCVLLTPPARPSPSNLPGTCSLGAQLACCPCSLGALARCPLSRKPSSSAFPHGRPPLRLSPAMSPHSRGVRRAPHGPHEGCLQAGGPCRGLLPLFLCSPGFVLLRRTDRPLTCCTQSVLG